MISKTLLRYSRRQMSQTPVFGFHSALKEKLQEIVPKKQQELKDIKKKYGNEQIGTITVDQALGGMRNMFGLVWDASLLHPKDGITFREYSIPDLCNLAQKVPGGYEPQCEGLLWLLMTGEIPDSAEFKNVSEEMRRRGSLSKDAEKFIASLPRDMHPMTQLSTALLYLQTGSKFAQAYRDGLHKSRYWEVAYEDAMDLIAKLPRVAALIYRHVYKNSDIIESDPNLDWAGNYANMLGFSSFEMKELVRGYLAIHSDHEGGNVSAHATHLVASALSDPYLAYSAGLNGLAGPLHGLANQECLRWLLDLKEELGNDISEQRIKEFAYRTLNEGKVIPGYGHAVLRHTDPRYIHLREFAGRHVKNDPLVELCRNCFQVIPGVLKELGKVKNPWPNVDAHSGVLLYHYGLKEFDYYTVVFAVSRALGCMTNLVWARAFGFPIERPGSVTLKWIKEKFDPESRFEK